MFSIGLVFDYRVVKWIINNLLKDLSGFYVTYKLKIRLLLCLSNLWVCIGLEAYLKKTEKKILITYIEKFSHLKM